MFLHLSGEVGVNHNTAAVFANDEFLVALDFDLLLRWYTVEAASTGVAVDNHNAEAVVHFVADALESGECTLVDSGLEGFGSAEKVFFFGTCLAYEVVESSFLFFKELGLVVNRRFDRFDFGVEIVNLALVVSDIFFAELNFERFVFYFLGEIIEFVIVAHIVELLFVAVDKELFVFDFVDFIKAAGLAVVDFALETLNARNEAFDGVGEVLHFLGELAADSADTTNVGVDELKLVECFKTLFYGEIFVFVFCCHICVTGILPDFVQYPSNRLQN